MNLVEKAKAEKPKRNRVPNQHSQEDTDLALAWINGEVATFQAMRVYNFTASNQWYSKAVNAIKQAIKTNQLKIVKVKK